MEVEALYCDVLPPRLQSEWMELLAQSHTPNFQYSFSYMQNWTQLLKKDWKCLLLLVKDEAKLKGIFPLMYRDEKRRGILPYRRLRFLGSEKTDFSTILAAPENLKDVIFSSLEWLFSGDFRWELMILDDLQEGTPSIEFIQQWLSEHEVKYELREGKYYFIDLERSWDDILADTSKKFVRRNINLAKNRIDNAGVWHFITDVDWDSDLVIERARFMHIERQKDLGRDSFFSDASELKFMENAIKDKSIGDFQSHWLLLNERYIAYMLGFEQQNIFYAWNMAFDPEYANLFPSKILLFELIKHCHEKKLKEFHFMRGESDYKTKWTKTYRINYCFTVHNTQSIWCKLSLAADNIMSR